MNDAAEPRTLDDWLEWLETLSPREIVLGLERVQDVLGRLAPGRPARVVNIAGTNGKGSSAAMLEAMLRRAGVRTGCYTSPHLFRYNERIRVDGRPADDGAVIAALRSVEAARAAVPLTFFEFGTLAALAAFTAAGTEAWILEVGMGGRLDAVNAIEPDACLITNVTLDHCAWLGGDIESIAAEKAGVMRPGKPAVFGAVDVPSAIHERAAEIGADLILPGRDFRFTEHGDRWSWRGRTTRVADLARPALAGIRQVENAAAVLALLEALGQTEMLTRGHIDAALGSVELPGRFQVIDDRWILDVAHNEAAGRTLDALLAGMDATRLVAVVGMLADKDVSGFLATFGDRVGEWIAVPTGSARGQAALATASAVANDRQKPCLVAERMDEALVYAGQRAGRAGRILVTGSFHVVGPALNWLARI